MNALRLTVATLVLAVVTSFCATSVSTAKDCCPPPPGKLVKFCVEDPCTCCKTEVCVCVPCCCADCEVPCLVGWKQGILGRKLLTYKFASCGHCVDVVILRNGDVKVR